MKTVSFGSATAPAVIAGMMRIDDKDDAHIRTLYETARTAGIDFFDHADIYGGSMHHCEARFADALQLTSSERDEIVLQTKCGIVPSQGMFDFSYAHIVAQVEGSLAALRTDRLDVLLLHRPDALVEPEEVARAFDDLESAGKVKAFGVSNHTPRQIDLLRTAVRQPLVANQLQLSITHAPIIAQPVAANMAGHAQSVVRDGGGIVEYCRINGITIQAWSPFQDGFSHGVFLGNPEYAELNAVIDRLAAAHDVTPIAIATAWITRHPAGMQVVLGTTTPQRVQDAAAGADIELTRPEWYELFRAGGHLLP
ncbi:MULTISPECIES: aldo/keto reductase family oxidoreductase [Microbacterium]|jgi:predicted oxidoreductase|uniref:Aldo/keto reductase family oxidoreductase n=1 Tax=Microbacterium maritypicum TaxID=33918 RepID=A0AAD3X3P0_MICMQ|nr:MULTISPECIES: aldo/keto reductase [Microbacterium]KAB1886682.1 aldo/keto reductase family oxidoreductase [Microbacterium liquefaciens]KQV01915.1 aldo/keto reductase [Microbacterium sp. Root322]QYG13212.1 aldo/keto reductase [Microbacterium sp. PAMC22086]